MSIIKDEIIKRIRAKNISQIYLSRRLNIPNGMITRWVRHDHMLPYKYMWRLCDELDIDCKKYIKYAYLFVVKRKKRRM